MNIAIIDDISADADILRSIVTLYFKEKQIETEIRYFSSGEEFFDHYLPGKFQLVFLDIYMDGMTGMDAAHRAEDTGHLHQLMMTVFWFLSQRAAILL